LTTSRTSPAGTRERDTLIRKSFSVTRTSAPFAGVDCDEQADSVDTATAHANAHGKSRAALLSEGVRRRTSCVFG
jgi:hypothetical protein